VWRARFQAEGIAEPFDVEVQALRAEGADTYAASVNGAKSELQIVNCDSGSGWIRSAGRIVPFHAVRTEHGVEVWIEGRVHRLRPIGRARARQRGAAEGGIVHEEIRAPMPGTILKINVAHGDAFEAHAPLIVMESMKMEMALSAPHAGRVQEVLCRVGELVPMGQVLARLEQEGADAAAPRQNR
jgi:3-methylcrotonyl-CoA carboxylase alpha subunit